MIQDVMQGPGRPTKYDPKYCQEIIDFMSRGDSLTAFAGEIQVSRETIYEWERTYPEFSDAINTARYKCQAWWETQGKIGLFMGKEDGTFSQSTWIFNMKARFGYRDKVEVETTGTHKIELAYNLDKEPEDG